MKYTQEYAQVEAVSCTSYGTMDISSGLITIPFSVPSPSRVSGGGFGEAPCKSSKFFFCKISPFVANLGPFQAAQPPANTLSPRRKQSWHTSVSLPWKCSSSVMQPIYCRYEDAKWQFYGGRTQVYDGIWVQMSLTLDSNFIWDEVLFSH